MKRKQKSLRQIASEIGVSESYLSQITHGKRPASHKVISSLNTKMISNLISNNVKLHECRGPESNWGHADFQSAALPTELPRRADILDFSPPGVKTKLCEFLCLPAGFDQRDAGGA